MGISRGAIKLIAMLLDAEERKGKAVTYGVQAVSATLQEVMALLPGARGVQLGAEESSRPATQGGKIHQDALFKLLGYTRIDSIDYYPNEGPTHVLDLNCPVPAHLHGSYDLVYDGGTMEHCFNTATFLQNTVDLVAPGGMVIHHVPMNNWIDHGFYQVSPTLFFDFYAANGFTDLEMVIHMMAKGKESYLPYDPRRDERLPYALGTRHRFLVFFKARKGAGTASGAVQVPIQGRYRQTFGNEVGESKRRSHVARWKRSLRKRTFTLSFKPL